METSFDTIVLAQNGNARETGYYYELSYADGTSEITADPEGLVVLSTFDGRTWDITAVIPRENVEEDEAADETKRQEIIADWEAGKMEKRGAYTMVLTVEELVARAESEWN